MLVYNTLYGLNPILVIICVIYLFGLFLVHMSFTYRPYIIYSGYCVSVLPFEDLLRYLYGYDCYVFSSYYCRSM